MESIEQRTPSDGRTPALIRQSGNHLKDSRSLYLRQHAHNPVDWYPWGEVALSRAKDEGKLIFLSIGYASCHWCHVMEEEVFEKDDVAGYLNEHFISIKVDREERPDIDASYMTALLAMTGSGGWPMSMFLTPDLKPFFGRTYLPREAFLGLAQRLNQLFHEDPKGVNSTAGEIARWLEERSRPSGGEALAPGAVERAFERAAAGFDERWGGDRSRMKFPTPARWQALLHHFRKTGEARWGEMVRTTLDALGSGGVHDQVGGGFHRYSVEESWMIPHFEKMLYDNAQLASLYLEAGAVLEEPRYKEIARRTLDFILREMTDPGGGFYASLDADSEGREGVFYSWSPEEINRVAGEHEGPPLAMLLGVTDEGNFEGQTVLSLRQPAEAVAARFLLDQELVDGLWERWRGELLKRRNERVGPTLDQKMVTSWNGMTIAALAQGFRLFGEDRFRKAAETAAESLWRRHRQGEGPRLFRVSNAGHAAEEGILDDYAFFAQGLLELFQATGEPRHLRRARALADYALDHFRQPGGGFFLTPRDLPSPLGRQVDIVDSVRPAGASALLHVLLSLAHLTGNKEYLEQVDQVLEAHGSKMQAAGMEMAWWFDVVGKRQGPFYVVIIARGADQKAAAALTGEIDQMMLTHALLVPPAGEGAIPKLEREIPSAAGKIALQGRPTAYVCTLGVCKRPTSDPAELRSQVLEGWAR